MLTSSSAALSARRPTAVLCLRNGRRCSSSVPAHSYTHRAQPRLSMAPQPTSVRKFSHEEAENRKAAHEASGGNKSQASEQPDPEDEEAVQVLLLLESARQLDFKLSKRNPQQQQQVAGQRAARPRVVRQEATCSTWDMFGFARQPGAHPTAFNGPSDQRSKPRDFVSTEWHHHA